MDEQELDHGQRLHRRRTTLTVLGAAASVALVAGVIAVATRSGDAVLPAPAPATTSASAAPSPSPSPSPSRSTAPSIAPSSAGEATDAAMPWSWSFSPDFPLDVDQVAMEGDGGEMRGPSPDETGLNDLTLCGAPLFSAYPAQRLASTATGPEYADMRELRVYPTTDEAAEEITRLRERLATPSCSQTVNGGGRLVHALIEADTGYDTVTWADYYTQGLGGGPVQVTRVGRAVLGVALGSEFSEASLDGADEPATEVTLAIAPEMCVFTEDGCGGPTEPELLQIGPDGMGPFRMGMTLGAARVAGGSVVAEDRCTRLEWTAEVLPRVSIVADPDLGVVSLAADTDSITPQGIATGSTYDELVAAYPDAEGDRSQVSVEIPDEDRFYRFDLAQGRVVRIALVARGQTCVS